MKSSSGDDDLTGRVLREKNEGRVVLRGIRYAA
jgi:hypothetical protein